MLLIQYLSDTEVYKKRVFGDQLFTALCCNKPISINAVNNLVVKDVKNGQVQKTRHNVSSTITRTTQYEMGSWKRCNNEDELMKRCFDS